ncbi:YARHG domain-containing protein [Flammeovirga aprica]|uniref:YARHG domain-containing protein n=1 Tax=Flammeovirga aprica JL-4 TaxID=694437 RepID=A0A7X9XBY1_9BACT|nr:YARHG domain-containing protein [Flammeovirga aprica]NME71069.1 YARHG domain-containing protein [Flammeovirga aprica JL-4]
MKKLTFIFLALITLRVFANDSAYYASGNQLIPITETDICVTKEVLTIEKKTVYEQNDAGETVGKQYFAYVTVDYTFFNPGPEKTILVGFEAPSPNGDVDGTPKNGAHPYISDFDVNVNSELLEFKTSIVNTENYYVNNKINAKTEEEIINNGFDQNSPDFYYVYHFNANFKSGLNKITHTYRFNMSGSVMGGYNFDYILTAANRWGNNQIDDFTLIIDMGISEIFSMRNTFFDDKSEWKIPYGKCYDSGDEKTKFITGTGRVIFHKKNFKPKGELYLGSSRDEREYGYPAFDYSIYGLPEYINSDISSTRSVDENSFKILRNLPFALRGYVFKTEVIQEYYSSQWWYSPKPEYKATLDELSSEEINWLEKVKSNKWDSEYKEDNKTYYRYAPY